MVDFNDIKFKGKDENFNNLKGGIKRESITDSSLLNIFDKVDNNPKDGILDAKEVSVFQQKVAEAAQGGRDAKLSKREAGKYLEGLGVKVENSALFSFINKLSSESTKVKSSTVNENGDSVTEYEDGTTETIKKDGTKIVKKGTTTTTYKKNADGEYIISEEVFVDPQDGSTTTTTYENGKKATSKKEYPNGNIEDTTYTDGKKSQTVKTLSNGNTETILYDGEEQPQKRTVTKDDGKTEEVYEYTNGSSFLTTKKENIGTDQERVTTYTKNQDGTITEKSEDSTGTKEVIKDGSNVIKEVVKNNDGSSYEKNVDGNVTTETTIDKSGNKTVKQTESQGENTVETVTDASKNKTRTVLNENGRALSQSYIDARTGKTQSVTYDGNGNTTGIVVQFGENAQRIANKFGCTKEELLEANGKKPGEDFEVGETIIVPKEIKANNKYLKNRKSAEAAIRAKQIDTQYRRMGLKNYERSGEKFEYGGKTYTVIGTMKTRARLLVRDSKGNITVASHDNKILKESYVLATNAFDSGEKVTGKARGQNGDIVDNGQYVRIGKRDAHGRSVVVDKNGQQWIMAHDGTLLKEEYVEASNVYDIAKDNLSTSTFNKGIKYAKVNGKVYYFSADGKVLDQKQAAKMEADAIIKELDDAADGFVFGLGTDEEQMIKANKAITDPAVLAYINEHYADKYADEVASGKYKSAYEAFLASEIKDREVYTLNADLVANGAILEQARRDEVIFTNLTTYGEHSENVNAGLKAVTTRTDYDNLQNASQKYNEEHGIKGHFEDQDSLQALLYHQTDGDAEEMDAANRNLTDGKSVLTEEEKIRIKAEVGTYYVEEGNTEKAYSSFNRDIYAQMDELLPEGKKVADTASQADRMIAGYGDFTNVQIADEAISYLKKAAKAYKDTEEQLSGAAAVNGAGTGAASIYHQNAEDFATKAFQLIKNDEILEIIMKKAPEDYKNITEKIKFETSGDIDFSKLMLESTSVEAVLSQDEISKNQQVVQLIKNNISLLEKSYRDSVDSEGFKMDFINGMRQTMFMGTTRDDVDNVYAIANSNLNKLSMAAEGKLVDANGQPIAFDKAVEMFTGMNLQELNNEYLTHQALGEAGFDVFTSLVTLPIGGAGALKLVGSVGTIGKAVKTVKTLNNVVKAVGSGVAVGTGQYMIDSADMQTSVMGNTMERRAAAENKAMEAGLSAAAGVGIGGATEQVASRVSSTAGKVLTQATGYSADLGSATAITASFNGGDWTEGFGMNAGITSVGYIFGVRTSIKMNGVNAKSLDDLLKLHKLGFENKNLPDPLSESNVNSLKKLKIDEAQNYLTDRGYKVEIKDNKLVYADNQGLHELSFSKTDGVVSNILDTSTKLSDTEFKQITDYMKKCDETEFNRIKQELIDGGLTEDQLKKLDEIVISTAERQSATDINRFLKDNNIEVSDNKIINGNGNISFAKDGTKYTLYYENGKLTTCRVKIDKETKRYYKYDSAGKKTDISKDEFLKLKESSNNKYNQTINELNGDSTPAPQPNDPANDIKLKQKLGEKLHTLYVKIDAAIDKIKNIADFNKLKTIIETKFDKFKEEMNTLISKLKAKAQSLELFDKPAQPSVINTPSTDVQISEDIKKLFSENTQNKLKSKLGNGQTAKLTKNDIEYTVKNNNGKIEIISQKTKSAVNQSDPLTTPAQTPDNNVPLKKLDYPEIFTPDSPIQLEHGQKYVINPAQNHNTQISMGFGVANLDVNDKLFLQKFAELKEGESFTVGSWEGNADYKIGSMNLGVSREHFTVIKENGQMVIVDKKSTNGTKIQNNIHKPISSQEIKSYFVNNQINPKLYNVNTSLGSLYLDEIDYKNIEKLMNVCNGRYINTWKSTSGTDHIENIQKLALLAKTLRKIGAVDDYLKLGSHEWDLVVNTTCQKDPQAIHAIGTYKNSSQHINKALSGQDPMDNIVKQQINELTNFLNGQTINKKVKLYRGDSYGGLSLLKTKNGKSVGAEMERLIANGASPAKIKKFVAENLQGKSILQERFMSTTLTKDIATNWAKKDICGKGYNKNGCIRWDIYAPAGTKGASVEDFTPYKLKENEVLLQRSSSLDIMNAEYDPNENIWIITAMVRQ